MYFLIPSFTHFIYRSKTSDKEIKGNRQLYNSVSNKINVGDSMKIKKNRKALDSLYLWFHVRDLPIDEGHDIISRNEQWQELFSYWKQ